MINKEAAKTAHKLKAKTVQLCIFQSTNNLALALLCQSKQIIKISSPSFLRLQKQIFPVIQTFLTFLFRMQSAISGTTQIALKSSLNNQEIQENTVKRLSTHAFQYMFGTLYKFPYIPRMFAINLATCGYEEQSEILITPSS